MTPIRVHVGPMPEMLRTIMRDLLSLEPDIVITGSSAEREDCLRAARRDGAEIILADDAGHTASCLDLMLSEPAFGLFAVSTDGKRASRVTLSRRTMALDPASRTNLADAIRSLSRELRAADAIRPGSNFKQAQPD